MHSKFRSYYTIDIKKISNVKCFWKTWTEKQQTFLFCQLSAKFCISGSSVVKPTNVQELTKLNFKNIFSTSFHRTSYIWEIQYNANFQRYKKHHKIWLKKRRYIYKSFRIMWICKPCTPTTTKVSICHFTFFQWKTSQVFTKNMSGTPMFWEF